MKYQLIILFKLNSLVYDIKTVANIDRTLCYETTRELVNQGFWIKWDDGDSFPKMAEPKDAQIYIPPHMIQSIELAEI